MLMQISLVLRSGKQLLRHFEVEFMNKIIKILLCCTSLFIHLSFYISVFADQDIKWELNDGVLIVSGNGEMPNYSPSNRAPWYSKRDEINRVIINDGITTIGSSSFVDCKNLLTVDLCEGITQINNMAFIDCVSLKNINIPSTLEKIGDSVFKGCVALDEIIFGNKIQYLGNEVFFRCISLGEISIPSTVIHLGEGIFSYCTSLKTAYIYANVTEMPDWTFFSCLSLEEITLSDSIIEIGSQSFENCVNVEETNTINTHIIPEIKSQISNSSLSSNQVEVNGSDNNDDFFYEIKEETNNSEITVVISKNDIFINANTSSQDGLKEVIDKADSIIDNIQDLVDESLQLNVTIDQPLLIEKEIINSLKDKNIKLTINHNNASFFFSDIENSFSSSDVKIGCTLKKIESPNEKIREVLGESVGYFLEFEGASDVNFTIKLFLGDEYAMQMGSLFQMKHGKWEHVQSSIIDESGYVTFYLSSYDSLTDYLIGINTAKISISEAIIPDSMSESYGGLTDIDGKPYEITGLKSSWGITINQFTFILFGMLSGIILLVGVIMYVIYRIRLNREKVRHEVMRK